MTFQVRQMAVGTENASEPKSPAAFGSNVLSGSTIVVCFGFQGGVSVTSVTDSLSNSYALVEGKTHSIASISAYQYRAKNVTGGACTITVDLSGSPTARFNVFAWELEDCDTSDPNDGSSDGEGNGTALSVASFTPSAADTIVVAHGMAQANKTWTAGASYTLITGQPVGGNGGEYRVLTSAGAQTAPFSVDGGASNWVEVAGAFKKASGGGGGPAVKALAALGVG